MNKNQMKYSFSREMIHCTRSIQSMQPSLTDSSIDGSNDGLDTATIKWFTPSKERLNVNR